MVEEVETLMTVRLAGEEDADAIHAGLLMIARHVNEENKVTSTVEDIRRHGFGPRPAFEVLIAEVGLAPSSPQRGEGGPQGRMRGQAGSEQAEIPPHRLAGSALLPAGETRETMTSAVVNKDKTFAGMCLFFPSFSTWRGQRGAYIQDIVVDERFRGRGIGIALLRHTAAHVREQGGTYLRLSVDAKNVSAQRFYERLGLTWSQEERIHAAYGDAFQLLAGLNESGV